jgi:ribonuclease E
LEGAGAEAEPVPAAEERPVPAAEGHQASEDSAVSDAHDMASGGDARPGQGEPQALAAEGAGGPSGAGLATYESRPATYTEPEVPEPHAQSAPAGDTSRCEPAHAESAHTEPAPDDASRPARKGWWQRRLSGA